MIYYKNEEIEYFFNPKNIFMISFDKNSLTAEIIPAGPSDPSIPLLFFPTEKEFLFFKNSALTELKQ